MAPVLTPDNYMQVIPGFLASAAQSIWIEQQYIRSAHSEVIKLLAAIRAARQNNPGLDVRIILGKLFSAADYEKEQTNVANGRSPISRNGLNVVEFEPFTCFAAAT